jgi:hypothetical protein
MRTIRYSLVPYSGATVLTYHRKSNFFSWGQLTLLVCSVKMLYATGTSPYSMPTVLSWCRRAVIRWHNDEFAWESQFQNWFDGETTVASWSLDAHTNVPSLNVPRTDRIFRRISLECESRIPASTIFDYLRHATVRYNKKLTKLVLRWHDLLNYANSSRQSRFKCCEDAETGSILLTWWCPFKIEKENLPTR